MKNVLFGCLGRATLLILCIFAQADLSIGEVYRVATQAQWNKLPTLQGGDVVLVAEGRIDNVVVEIKSESVSEAAQVRVVAETPGKTVLCGKTRITFDGDWITLAGFVFADGGPGHKEGAIRFDSDTSHCRLTNCSFNGFDQGTKDCNWVFFRGYHQRVDHCSFAGKASKNATLFIKPHDVEDGPDAIRGHQIDHNYFGTRQAGEGNGYESIRVGDSSRQQYRMGCVIESNYFYQTIKSDDASEMEIVSNKSRGNVYRNNVFEDCDGQLTLRHGRDCLVEGNWFIGTGGKRQSGVRVIGSNHVIRGNTFCRLGGTNLRSALCLMDGKYGDDKSSRYEGVENVVIEDNVFYECRQPVNMGESKGPSDPPREIIFKNNRIRTRKGYELFVIESDVSIKTSEGNRAFHAQGSYGSVPAGTATGPFELDLELTDKPVNAEEVKPAFEAVETGVTEAAPAAAPNPRLPSSFHD